MQNFRTIFSGSLFGQDVRPITLDAYFNEFLDGMKNDANDFGRISGRPKSHRVWPWTTVFQYPFNHPRILPIDYEPVLYNKRNEAYSRDGTPCNNYRSSDMISQTNFVEKLHF